MKNDEDFNKVNKSLREWNPINVPDYLKLEEYKTYAPIFINIKDDIQKITFELEKIALDISGYNPNNPQHKNDIKLYTKKIYDALNKF